MAKATVVGALREWLDGFDPGAGRHCHVAFSGGLDSTVLLHALACLRGEMPSLRIEALHVDHALHPDSRRWARRCRESCHRLDVRLRVHRLQPLDSADGGPESAARQARYAWFARRLSPGGALVTAHHLADQAETLLYNLFRGTGLRGLAAMPVERAFARGVLARPLLGLPRDTLAGYAAEARLDWIEDPSNAVLDHDRNYIRHRVMPVISARWPAAARSMHRTARNLGDSSSILERLAARQMVDGSVAGAFNPLCAAPVLDAASLAVLPGDECLHLLRHWITSAGGRPPSRERLVRLRHDLVLGDAATGLFSWSDGSVRRYRGRLYLAPPLPGSMPEPASWRAGQDYRVPGLPLILVARRRRGRGVVVPAGGEDALRVDFATADRLVRERPGGPRRSLRKIFQEAGVPPWLRRVLPRISAGGALLCVPGVVESGAHRAGPGQPGLCFELLHQGGEWAGGGPPPR